MLHTCAKKLSSILIKKCGKSTSQEPIFTYGCELAFSTLSAIGSILLLSSITHTLFFSLIFLSIFVSIRLYAGGFHARTYMQCFVVTNLTHWCTYSLSLIFVSWGRIDVPIIIALLCTFVIICLSPIKNKKHPLSIATYRKNKIIACILAITALLVVLVSAHYAYFHLCCISTSALVATAVMMIIPKLQERRTSLCGLYSQ